MTKLSRAPELTGGVTNKRAPQNYPKSRPNHESHQFVGARNFDPVLDALKNETEQQGEVEPCLRVIEPPERGRPQISIRRSLNSGDFEAVFVLEIASVQPPDSPLHRQSKSTIDFRRIMDIESTIRDRCPRSSKEFR